MEDIRKELKRYGLDTSNLEKIEHDVVESGTLFKVYIYYEFFNWEDSTDEELYVLYTEDESLAERYYNFLQDVESALTSRCGEPNYFNVKLEKMPIYKTVGERCPFCGEPVDRRKGYYCPNCGST